MGTGGHHDEEHPPQAEQVVEHSSAPLQNGGPCLGGKVKYTQIQRGQRLHQGSLEELNGPVL